jgi:hypothetical protein
VPLGACGFKSRLRHQIAGNIPRGNDQSRGTRERRYLDSHVEKLCGSARFLVLLGFVWVNFTGQAKLVVGRSMVSPPQQR